jgi:catechol 2,3-dioxygenase-like lactoylglutathione lyase family enzyme
MKLDVIQLGLNTSDLPATLLLYSQAFGFQNSGSQILSGEVVQIQGLSRASRALMWWMVGAQPFFQLEFFHHTRPPQRPLRSDWTAADCGWTRFGIAVGNFDESLAVLEEYGIATLNGIHTVDGGRRAAFRDPHIGVIAEIMEDTPALAELHGAAGTPSIVYAAASVSDLKAAQTYYRDVLGLELSPTEQLNTADYDAIWGMADSQRTSFVARSGRIALEISEYVVPVGRARAEDYRCSDQGFVNIALGAADKAPVEAVLSRLRLAGYSPPYVMESDSIVAAYIIDPEREIEIATIPPEIAGMVGFEAGHPFIGFSR